MINTLCRNALSVACALGEEKVSAAVVRQIRKEKDIMNDKALEACIARIRNPLSRKIITAAAVLIPLGIAGFFGKDAIKSVTDSVPAFHANRQADSVKATKEQAEQQSPLKTTAEAVRNVEVRHEKTEPKMLAPVKQPDMGMRVKTVVEATRGVSISSLALKHYNKVNMTIIDYILDMNPSIANPDLILINQKIKLPEISERMLIRQEPEGFFKVHLATFTSRSYAAKYMGGITMEGKALEMTPRKVSPSETWYRVMVGPYVDRHEASKALDEMKKRGILLSLDSDMRR
jgi:phage tail protein X